jgi:hypothetical protein
MSTAKPGFPSCLPSPYPRTAHRSVPGTWSGGGCRLLVQLWDSSEGMPWPCMVLSLVPHQMPLHGERCSPVCRRSPSASSGGLWLPETSTCPSTTTPARRGRCTAEESLYFQCRCWCQRLVWPVAVFAANGRPRGKPPGGAGHGAGQRIAQLQVARPIGRSMTAGGSDRVCTTTRALGRTPRERHHRSDDRLLWPA